MPGTANKATTHVGNDNRHRHKTHKTFPLSEFHTHFGKDAENLYANHWQEKAKIPAENPTPVGSVKAKTYGAAHKSKVQPKYNECICVKSPVEIYTSSNIGVPNSTGSDGVNISKDICPINNGLPNSQPQRRAETPTTINLEGMHFSRHGHGRGGRVRSCPRIPTPTLTVPRELVTVDSMTSAEFRHDYGAHLENMRMRQKDQKHMQFFQSIIEDNKHLFVGRTILVMSCGPGTLALMAARAGAAHVYAIDYSNVTDYAQLVVKQNCYEHVITVLHGHVADLELPNQRPVDGIICNWMGHCLLYESELVQLLQARDRWLKPNGFILPDLAALYLMGGEEQLLKNERCNWWLDVYGFNMNAMRRYSLAEPRYAKIKGNRLLTLAHKVMNLDLNTATIEDLQIDRSIRLQAQHEGYLECFVLYFDVAFSRAHQPLKFSCNPWLESHLKSLWLQTVLFVEKPFVMRPNNSYTGHLIFGPLKKERQLSRLNLNEMKIEIEFYESNVHGICNPAVRKSWLMTPRFQTVQEVAHCQDKQYLFEI